MANNCKEEEEERSLWDILFDIACCVINFFLGIILLMFILSFLWGLIAGILEAILGSILAGIIGYLFFLFAILWFFWRFAQIFRWRMLELEERSRSERIPE
jgi:hypothetical protein